MRDILGDEDDDGFVFQRDEPPDMDGSDCVRSDVDDDDEELQPSEECRRIARLSVAEHPLRGCDVISYISYKHATVAGCQKKYLSGLLQQWILDKHGIACLLSPESHMPAVFRDPMRRSTVQPVEVIFAQQVAAFDCTRHGDVAGDGATGGIVNDETAPDLVNIPEDLSVSDYAWRLMKRAGVFSVEDQVDACALMVDHIKQLVDGYDPGQLALHICGEGGTGKTHIIRKVIRPVVTNFFGGRRI